MLESLQSDSDYQNARRQLEELDYATTEVTSPVKSMLSEHVSEQRSVTQDGGQGRGVNREDGGDMGSGSASEQKQKKPPNIGRVICNILKKWG